MEPEHNFRTVAGEKPTGITLNEATTYVCPLDLDINETSMLSPLNHGTSWPLVDINDLVGVDPSHPDRGQEMCADNYIINLQDLLGDGIANLSLKDTVAPDTINAQESQTQTSGLVLRMCRVKR